MTQEERIQRLENLSEANIREHRQIANTLSEIAQLMKAQVIESNQRATETDRRFQQVEAEIAALTQAQQAAIERERMLMETQQRLAENLAFLRENLASVNAAVERLDRLVDYFLRRERDDETT